MDIRLDGETRIYYVVGDPIAQVKSPTGVTTAFQQRGLNAVCIPAHVGADQLAEVFQALKSMRNVDGIMVTVPHKIAFTSLCDQVSERARFLNTVNTVRREGDLWVGDMFDGLAQVEALSRNGAQLAGKKVILAGAGGAGTAIAHALLEAGVAELAIHESDQQRRTGGLQRENRARPQTRHPEPSGPRDGCRYSKRRKIDIYQCVCGQSLCENRKQTGRHEGKTMDPSEQTAGASGHTWYPVAEV